MLWERKQLQVCFITPFLFNRLSRKQETNWEHFQSKKALYFDLILTRTSSRNDDNYDDLGLIYACVLSNCGIASKAENILL